MSVAGSLKVMPLSHKSVVSKLGITVILNLPNQFNIHNTQNDEIYTVK